MPGIFGIIRKNSESRETNESLLSEMLRRLSHNTHYVSQTYCDSWFAVGNIGLPVAGEERLAVDETRKTAAAFSGYIYGWKNLDSTLSSHTEKKASRLIDIFHAYHNGLPEKIDGSFNAVIFDIEGREALLCNDRFGHRQLYYYEDEDLFLFAPEIKAFMAYEKFSRDLDFHCIADYFNYGYPLGERTFFKKVKILRGGHKVIFKNGRINFQKYWDYQFGEESRQSLDELIEEADSIYRGIVRKQTTGAKNIILPLSGGLDSRFILSHALQADIQPHAFTHGRRNCLDHRIARQVAEKLAIKHYRFIEIDPCWLVQYSEKFISLTDGMLESSPAILLGISSQYGLEPSSSAFINGIFGGPTNFGSSYFRLNDIIDNISHQEKLRRIRYSLSGTTEDLDYRPFLPDFGLLLKKRYLPSIDEEFSRYLGISPLFCNQKDIFFIRNRIARYMNLVDCNRHIWHDHFALADDRLVDFFIKLPVKIKPSRAFLIEYFKKKLPELAQIRYQGTGVNLYQRPSPFKAKLGGYERKCKHYLERLSGGQLKFYNMKNYHHYNQWYRTHRQISDYYEGILLDERTSRRGYYDMTYLESLLRRQKRGTNCFTVISSLATFEMFNRLFVD